MTTTVNMNLTLPVVGVTLGPEYAEINNEAFEEIDSHDHTASKGVAVPTAGLNINADLPFNGFAATEVNALTLQDVSGTPADLSVYSDSGDLYYINAAGNPVQLTVGDTIAGAPGTITGLGGGGSSASFSDLAEDFTWFYNGAKHAAFNVGDIRLYPFDGASAYLYSVSLKSPTALPASYSLTLPTALPANTNFVQVTSAGTLSFTNTITRPILGADGSVSSPTYGFSTGSGTGIYQSSFNVLGFTTSASLKLTISNTVISGQVPYRTSDGLAATPSVSFNNDTDTGMYLVGDNVIGFSTGGSQKFAIGSSNIDVELPIRVLGGSDGSPTLTFQADSNTGLYLAGTDSIGFTTGGGSRMTVTNSAVNVLNALTTPSIDIASGGAFKVKVINMGSTTSTSSVTLSVAHGLTVTNIRAISGTVHLSSNAFATGYTFGGADVQSWADSTDVKLNFTFVAGGTKTGYVTIFYV